MNTVLLKKPVSGMIGLLLVVIFGMYQTGSLKKLPCENNLINNVFRDFIHVDFYHLLVNIFGLYYISNLEPQLGSGKYMALVAVIIALSSVLTFIANSIFKFTCSIGFSGVLLGIMTFILLMNGRPRNNDIRSWKPLLYLVATSINPGTDNVSVSGHLIGIVAGVIAFVFMKN